MRKASITVAFVCSLALATSASAGAIFLTGHDPDFHAIQGGNAAGAQNINNAAINFILGASNPFVGSTTLDFLFVESTISPPPGHVAGVNGIVASGYGLGTDFQHHDASTLDAEINQLGTKYAGIVIASDFGGVLTQAELDILNARSSDIIAFLNAGGGLYAMAESNLGQGLTPSGGHFGYLPFIVSSAALNQSESGFTVTGFGSSLGLTNADVNGNASHNIFTGTPLGLQVVDFDDQQNIMTLAGIIENIPENPVPEPASLVLLLTGILGGGVSRIRRRS